KQQVYLLAAFEHGIDQHQRGITVSGSNYTITQRFKIVCCDLSHQHIILDQQNTAATIRLPLVAWSTRLCRSLLRIINRQGCRNREIQCKTRALSRFGIDKNITTRLTHETIDQRKYKPDPLDFNHGGKKKLQKQDLCVRA